MLILCHIRHSYKDHVLIAKAWQIIERLLSKREKLILALMRTYVVADNKLVAFNSCVDKQIDLASKMANGVASFNDVKQEW